MLRRLQRWARGHTRRRRYSPVGVAFHWAMAALVLFQLWWGWRTGDLPPGGEKLEAYQVHADLGLAILVLALARMAWRLMVPGPVNDADKPGWQSTTAHLTHYAFYLCLIGLPLSGWAMLSATAPEFEFSLAGVVSWPPLPFHDLPPPLRWRIEAWAEQAHWLFVIGISGLIVAHAGAALKHELFDQDDVLRGMLPGLPTLRRLAREARRRMRRELRPRRASGGG